MYNMASKELKENNRLQNEPRSLAVLYKDICNNCCKYGHNSSNCKMPIISFGVVVFRNNPEKGREYLMICRKDSLGYIDFIRGKYQLIGNCKIDSPCLKYIMNMIKQMTINEKKRLQTKTFKELWCELWGNSGSTKIQPQYKLEESSSQIKFQNLKKNGILDELINISNRDYPIYEVPEFGFPKGRRGYGEKDFACAIRETVEETGIIEESFINIKNILPFNEVFMGSNYKSYKHQYYLMKILYENSQNTNNFERSEVSSMEWFSFDECMKNIREYNIEKKRMLFQINTTIDLYNNSKM